MQAPLPDTYRRLAPFSVRLPAGTRLYEQGAQPDRFYIVLRGEVHFEAMSEHGDPEVVAVAGLGGLVGHVAAITRRPTSAAARLDADAVLLAIPVARLAEAIREAPDLGLRLIYEFAGVDPTTLAASGPPEVHQEGDALDEDVVPVRGEYDSAVFFTDIATCPVSQTRFQFLRMRTRAVRPQERASDFHVRYQGTDPTWYSLVVCPTCGYTSYFDDFTKVDEHTRSRLWDGREERIEIGLEGLSGIRDDAGVLRVLDLAMRCYEQRGASASRRAVLEHRRAWLAREAGDVNTEQMWLRRARDSYQAAFEHDTRISEEAAARVAYLVGDISMRLSEHQIAAQWLETAVRVAPKTASGIARTARDRLQDVRELIKQERLAS